MTGPSALLRAVAALIPPCGVYQFRLGLYFIAIRPPLLPGDLRFLGIGREAPTADLPPPAPWLHWVFMVTGGQMAAVGGLTLAAALRLFRRQVRDRRELVELGVAGALSAANVDLESDSRWLLMLPTALWALGQVFAVMGVPGGRPST